MTLLNIFSLNDTQQQNVIASLPEGQHLIGRGELLKVSDKRVSRKHAVIEVAPDKVTLISLHVNPCFFKAGTGQTLTVLTKDQENELSDGDQFALLPDDYWFKVKIKRDEEDGFRVTKQANGKRTCEGQSSGGVDLKKARLSQNLEEPDFAHPEATTSPNNIPHSDNNAEAIEFTIEELAEPQNSATHITEATTSLPLPSWLSKKVEDSKFAVQQNIQDEPDTSFESSKNIDSQRLENLSEISHPSQHFEETACIEDVGEEQKAKLELVDTAEEAAGISNKNIKVEPQEANNEAAGVASGSSGPNQGAPRPLRRERCWYGDGCFRKNPNHRDMFSHPGDQDYQTDPEDDRPDCPYRAACYRRNLDHRREYKHPSARPAQKPRALLQQPAASPTRQAPQTQQKRPRKQPKKPEPDYDSEDDYDYNDPFLNDGSSDDYEPSDDLDSSETDVDDSQATGEEESQERNRMLLEAKRFMKK